MLNFHINNRTNSVLFKGYPEDIKLCEQVNKQVHQMNLQSPSHLKRRQYDRKLSGLGYRENYRKYKHIERLFDKLQPTLNKMRKSFRKMAKFGNPYDEYINTLLDKTSTFKIANCGEMAFIAQYLLGLEGKKTDVVTFNILARGTDRERTDKGVNDHTFLIMNLREKADVNNPQTWGRETIIIDPWLGITRRANLALKQIKELMNFDSSTEYLKFEKSNYQDLVDSYRKRSR